MVRNLDKADWLNQVVLFLQGFGKENDVNKGKFIGSNFGLCKSISQSEVIFIVYFEPNESVHVKINCS